MLFGKAVFTRHPDLLERVLGELARIRRRVVLHGVSAREPEPEQRRTHATSFFP